MGRDQVIHQRSGGETGAHNRIPNQRMALPMKLHLDRMASDRAVSRCDR